MIPAKFEYVAPASVEEALAALAEHGDDAKIIAGGQSLLPVLRMRLNAPEVVIDLGKIEALKGVRDDGDAIVIGAMTTHHDVQHDPLVKEHALLISRAETEVADPQVRHRGTFGGALAHADPAAELPGLAEKYPEWERQFGGVPEYGGREGGGTVVTVHLPNLGSGAG